MTLVKGLYLVASLASLAVAQYTTTSQTFDDTDPIIVYSGDWIHQSGVTGPYNNTQSFSNVATASYSFTFAGTGFSICAGRKSDRGPFNVTIDNVLAGTGTQLSTATDATPACTTVFAVDSLSPAGHTVVVQNMGNGTTPYLTVDSITLEVLSEAVPTSSTSSSSSSSSRTSSSTGRSSSVSRSVSSGSSAAISASSAAANAGANNTSGGTSTGAIAGGVVGGILALALIGGLLWWCCCRRKRRSSARDDAYVTANPFVSDMDADETGASKFNMSQNSTTPILFTNNDSPLTASTSMFPGQPGLPPAVPIPATNQERVVSGSSFDNRYSNQYMTAAPAPSRRTSYVDGPASRRTSYIDAPAASRRTSYVSAMSAQPPTPAAVPQIPMSFSAGGRASSPFTMPAFPTDVDEQAPVEDAYGGLVEDSEEDDPSSVGHIRRASEVDLVVTKAMKGSTRRKPVPQA